jgi:hypothetical protein
MNITELPLDANGHWLTRRGVDTVTVFQIDAMSVYVPDAMSRCALCDWHPKFEVADGSVRATEPCALPDGVTTVVDVAFPSGKIIVTDDLRPVYDWREPDGSDAFASYNSALGQAQAIKAMAAIGCAYGPVGNSCPNLYRMAAPNRYVIASPAYSDDGDDEGLSASVYQGAQEVAGICTDLWAYSICDYDDYLARGGDRRNIDRWSWTVVDVTPGVYRFTHHTGERGFDHDADELVFAHVERVGDA